MPVERYRVSGGRLQREYRRLLIDLSRYKREGSVMGRYKVMPPRRRGQDWSVPILFVLRADRDTFNSLQYLGL